jgi:hypothetical protein
MRVRVKSCSIIIKYVVIWVTDVIVPAVLPVSTTHTAHDPALSLFLPMSPRDRLPV